MTFYSDYGESDVLRGPLDAKNFKRCLCRRTQGVFEDCSCVLQLSYICCLFPDHHTAQSTKGGLQKLECKFQDCIIRIHCLSMSQLLCGA
jgi:hypothetical protein